MFHYSDFKRDYDKAISYFNSSLEIKPNDLNSLDGKGWSYYQKGNYANSIKSFSGALEIKPNYVDALVGRGWSYYRKSNFEKAILDFNGALAINPNHTNMLNVRGWAFYFTGDFEKAIKSFNKTIENIESTNKDILKDALRGKAFSYLGLGDGQTAINLINKAKEALDYDTSYDLSLLYYLIGNKEQALKYRGGGGMIGVEVRDYKMGNRSGAKVVRALPKGPMEKAGVLASDVIIELNNIDIVGMQDLVKNSKKLVPGTIAQIKILREGVEKNLTFQVGSAEALMEQAPLIAPIIAKRKSKAFYVEQKPVKPAITLSFTQKIASNKNSKTKKPIAPPTVSLPTAPPTDYLTDVAAASLDFGSYHALIVGNNDYRHLPKLRTAVNDAKAMAVLLQDKYGFELQLLLNATRADILRAINGYRRTLGQRDNLLIYYAGHGWLDEDADQGYWLPVDATRQDPTNWISNGSITDALRAMEAKHVLVIADSCYSGKLARGINVRIRTKNYYEKISRKKARSVMASGGLEPVAGEAREYIQSSRQHLLMPLMKTRGFLMLRSYLVRFDAQSW